MGAVRGWLLAVIAVSLLCALAGALMPKGAVKQVGRLICGLVLMGTVLSPAGGLDAAEGQRWLEDYFASVEWRQSELQTQVDDRMKGIIEQECAAYIVDKAAELGLDCRARVECRASEDGVYLPARAELSGAGLERMRTRLTEVISGELGIPEGQITIQEEMP